MLNDRESETFAPPGPAPLDRLWTREEVAQELRYLGSPTVKLIESIWGTLDARGHELRGRLVRWGAGRASRCPKARGPRVAS